MQIRELIRRYYDVIQVQGFGPVKAALRGDELQACLGRVLDRNQEERVSLINENLPCDSEIEGVHLCLFHGIPHF